METYEIGMKLRSRIKPTITAEITDRKQFDKTTVFAPDGILYTVTDSCGNRYRINGYQINHYYDKVEK